MAFLRLGEFPRAFKNTLQNPYNSSVIGFVSTPDGIAELMVSLADADKDSIVLDSGCGEGVFMKALAKAGYQNFFGIELDPYLYDFCKKTFPQRVILGDFLDFSGEFDLIIGNPPYVHYNSLPDSIRKKVLDITKTRESDIYYAFIIKAIELLKQGGELIYIVPYHFFYNTYAKLIRETILKTGKIEVIIDLGEACIFGKERPETVIFKFRKGIFDHKREKIRLIRLKKRSAGIDEISQDAKICLGMKKSSGFFDYVEINHFTDSERWSSYSIEIPDFGFKKLGDIAKVGVGFVSGFDRAFLIDEDLPSDEMGLIRRFVKAKHCKGYIVDGYTSYIFTEDIKDENELRRYPNIYKRLLNFKDKLMKRHLPKQKEWFRWQAVRNYRFFTTKAKRIYVPALDRKEKNRFSLGDLFPAGDTLFIQPFDEADIYFLLGYLNSSFFRMYYLAKGARRGGRISWIQSILSSVEIPAFSDDTKNEISEIVKEIIDRIRKNQETSSAEAKIDDLIIKNLQKMTKINV